MCGSSRLSKPAMGKRAAPTVPRRADRRPAAASAKGARQARVRDPVRISSRVPTAPEVVQVRSARVALCRWDDLSPEARSVLARGDISSVAQFASISPQALRQLLQSVPSQAGEQLIACWRGAACATWRSRDREALAGQPHLRLACTRFLSPRLPGCGTVGGALGLPLPLGRSGDVPPLPVLSALQSAASSGSDPAAICQSAMQGRVVASISCSSAITYASHIRSVARFCNIMRRPAVPATAELVLLYATVCGCAATLRGHIAVWHKAHLLAGIASPHIPSDYRGTAALQAPRRPRPGARRQLVEAIARAAVLRREFRFAAACVLAYVFLLRVPSELLGQFRVSNTRAARGWGAAVGMSPGALLVRKNRPAGTTLSRACTCREHDPPAQLCPHMWLQYLRESCPDDLLFEGYSYSRFISDLRSTLRLVASSDPVLREHIGDPATWGSHAFRTGAGRDILAASGVTAARDAGQWDSLAGLQAYTTADGIDARALAEVLVESADDEVLAAH